MATPKPEIIQLHRDLLKRLENAYVTAGDIVTQNAFPRLLGESIDALTAWGIPYDECAQTVLGIKPEMLQHWVKRIIQPKNKERRTALYALKARLEAFLKIAP